MTDKPANPAKSKSHETRRRNTARRLRQAFDRLVAGNPQDSSRQGRPSRLTVAALAREARVSRNTIYAEHSEFLDELASANPPGPATHSPAPKPETAKLRALIGQLQEQKRLLATENAGLLKRAIDAERAMARLEKQNAKLVQDIRVVHRLSST
ncbi:hypothetical protein [Rhizobium sp. MHM7A]|uniref:hypothetical protein n=1 Tax=Rhizobium sp. MHM7A TaxID=2583233 RepID=UPI0011066327|nr:hypothetical protein [Rhizobium sp. MHM7A]TLW99320.1 hypothetical protein FFR93_37805 [Rhizobium sp. MHM7A]